MNKESCFECQFAKIDGGFIGNREEPPSPACLEDCQCDKTSPEFFEEGNEESWAMKCGYFLPILINNCAECGIKMGVPRYNWNQWARGGWTDEPCCCPLCTARLQMKMDEQIREEIQAGKGLQNA